MKTITLLALSMLVLVGISAAPKSDDKAGQVKINGTVTHYHAICGATFSRPPRASAGRTGERPPVEMEGSVETSLQNQPVSR